uniref:RNA-dependent RNA polymerase n=1 Tax=Heligmosomoides polygyrus TaxID=6339 RepID=A0A183F6N7_HELPZ
LARVRQENIIELADVIPTATPIYDMLKENFEEHIKENFKKFVRFNEFSNNEAAYQLKRYTTRYEGLNRVMFIVSEWAERNQLYAGKLQSHHICLILILYGTGLIAGSMNRGKPLLDKVDDDDDGGDVMDDDHQVELFLGFFEYLASRAFRKLPSLSFDDLGYTSVFLRGEWLPLREAAVKTYYNMVFNHRFDELKNDPYDDATYGAIVRECEPFVIELPDFADTDRAERRIVEKTGVEEVALRRIASRQTGRVTVSARGTVQSLRNLRELVTVKPLIKSAARDREISDQLCCLTYENIMK